MEFSAKQLADFLQGEIIGNPNVTVNNFSKIEEGKPQTLTFLSNPKYTYYIYDTKADIVLVNADFKPEKEIKATLIKVVDAYEAIKDYAKETVDNINKWQDGKQRGFYKAGMKYAVDKWGKDEVSSWLDEL